MYIAAESILLADNLSLYAFLAAGDVLLLIIIVTVPSGLLVNCFSNSLINLSILSLFGVTTLSKNEVVCSAVLGDFY